MTISKDFATNGLVTIALYLMTEVFAPDLNIGTTFEFFRVAGTHPITNDLLNSLANGFANERVMPKV